MEMQDWLNWIVPVGTILAALISARASRISASAARRSNGVALDALEANRKIAENDWRIRMMDERIKIYNIFIEMLESFIKWDGMTSELAKIYYAKFEHVPFIFEPEIESYLYALHREILRHDELNQWVKSGECVDDFHSDARETVLKSRRSDKMYLDFWIPEQLTAGKELFKKHMSILG